MDTNSLENLPDCSPRHLSWPVVCGCFHWKVYRKSREYSVKERGWPAGETSWDSYPLIRILISQFSNPTAVSYKEAKEDGAMPAIDAKHGSEPANRDLRPRRLIKKRRSCSPCKRADA